MILNDEKIMEYCLRDQMITPFVSQPVREESGKKVISYGLGHYGYDIRMTNQTKIICPRSVSGRVIDPKDMGQGGTHLLVDDLIPPHTSILTSSVEYFNMPTNVIGICVGKSTYARCGLIVNVTPLEPGWVGYLTIELTNTTDHSLKIYPHEGIAQILFFEGSSPLTTYATKSGKYQGQIGVTSARV